MPTRPRSVSAHNCNVISPAPEAPVSPAQSPLPADIEILTCVTLGKLLNFSVPHFPICMSVAKARWCMGATLCSNSHGCCGDGPCSTSTHFSGFEKRADFLSSCMISFQSFPWACACVLTLSDDFHGFSGGLCPSPM